LADRARVVLPDAVLERDLGPGFADWRARLPRLAQELLEDWGLRLDGGLRSGLTAVVLPVRDADGRAAALKVAWPHDEAEHEHLVLRAWAGRGAVRLLRADPARWALLLERADADADLAVLGDVEACEVVGGLYGLLHRPALPQLRRLSDLAEDWAVRLHRLERHPQVPRRFVVQAVSHLTELAGLPTTDGTLVHTDLHYANVLASLREGGGVSRAPASGTQRGVWGVVPPQDTSWLAIDPKPLSGDPAYEVAPLLWNRTDELRGPGASVRDALLDRFYAVVDAAGLDEDRARAWVVVRGMVNVLWAVEEAERGQPLDAAGLTVQTTMIKAMIP
jgi:streptomycin 6-kinase